MTLLKNIGYDQRHEGETKTVFVEEYSEHKDSEIVYAVRTDNAFQVIGDDKWYDRAAEQASVWDHNIKVLQEHGSVELPFDSYDRDMMSFSLTEPRLDNATMISPAIRAQGPVSVEPWGYTDTYESLTENQQEQVELIQDEVTSLIDEGMIAVKYRENSENDFVGPGCLRQFGEGPEGDVYLLDFGEWHTRLEGPHNGPEFKEVHDIQEYDCGVRSPIITGDHIPKIPHEYRDQ